MYARTISRDREFLAYEEGVMMTRKPRTLMSALIKLYKSYPIIPKNKFSMIFPMRLFAQETSRWKIFRKHPPIAERLERLLELENKNHKYFITSKKLKNIC